MSSNNPFEAHGIKHLSASSINQFISNPASWILKVSGHRGPSNPAMWRGTAIDDAISWAFDYEGNDIAAPINMALNIFDERWIEHKKSNEYDYEKVRSERDNIERYLEVAMPFYRKLGKPESIQKRIEIDLDLPVPVIGFIDLQYPGMIRDIKTTGRMMPKTPSSICRQLSLYAYAENCSAVADFIHVTKTKAEVVTVEITDIDKRLEELRKASLAMMNVLSYSDDINQVASLFYPDFDDWRWNNPADVAAAKKLWGIK